MQVSFLIILHIFTIAHAAFISNEKQPHDSTAAAITLNVFRSLYNSKYLKVEVNAQMLNLYLDLKNGSSNNIYENGIEPPFTVRLAPSLSKITQANFTYTHSEQNSVSLSPTKDSFVHLLYKQGFIYSKRFLMHKHYTNVSFGFNDEWRFLRDSRCKLKLYPEVSNGFWEISIKTINGHPAKTLHHVNTKGYIHTDDDFVIIDKDTFTWLKDDYFHPYLNNNSCYYATFKSSSRLEHVIECNFAITRFLPNITMVINSRSKVTYVPYDNFECFVEGCFFNMIYDSNSNSSEWKLGNSFLSRYYALFDYDDYSITLYSNDSGCECVSDGRFWILGINLISIGVAALFEVFVKVKYL